MRLTQLVPIVALAVSSAANAQSTASSGTGGGAAASGTAGMDAHGFNLVAFDADPRDPLTIERPGWFLQNDWFVGGVLEYAKAPLVYVPADPVTGEAIGDPKPMLDNVVALNLSVGWAVIDQIRLDASAPLYFYSTGPGGAALTDPQATAIGSQGAGVGDIRLAAMLAPVQPDPRDGGVGVGLIPYIDLPSGSAADMLGVSTVDGGVKAAATYELDKVTLTGEVGAWFGPDLTTDDLKNLTGSDALTTGAAIGINPTDTLGINVEGHFLSPFSSSTDTPGTNSPGEAILSLRKTTATGGNFMAGAAAGVLKGASAAQFRVFVGGGYGMHHPPPPLDTDLDGIMDPDDACVTDPETKNGFKDEDGCPDGPSKLRVVVQNAGANVAGAEVTIQPADGAADMFTSQTDAHEVDSWPGTAWHGTATMGSCLAGSADVTMQDDPATRMEIQLAPVLDGQLQFEIQDVTGNWVNSAQVTFDRDPQGCSPSQGLTGDGHASTKAGAGTHGFQISAPGFQPYADRVTLAKGETKVIHVQLTPTRVQLTEKSIVILDKVFFETNKAIIKPESYSLLNEVAKTIISNPQVGRVEVGGHTDSQGSDSFNMKLSAARAESVKTYLIGQGVEPDRLLSAGYGETKPIDTNSTPEGRAMNRRVEFNLIDKK